MAVATLTQESSGALAVSDQIVEQAKETAAQLDSLEPHTPLQVGRGQTATVTVPAELADMVREVVQAVARGASITLATLPKELTTTVAAKELGISRPTLMKLIAEGRLPAHKVGTHTRIKTVDVRAFAERRVDEQRRAFAELREFDDELGLEN